MTGKNTFLFELWKIMASFLKRVKDGSENPFCYIENSLSSHWR